MTRYIPGRGLSPGNVLWVWPMQHGLMEYGQVESRLSQKPQLRIGDADRDRAVAALGDHFAAGRLTNEEFEQRMEQAIKARFNEDLEPLFADLPRTVEPVAEQRSNRASEAQLAWSVMMWLAPVFILCAVVAAVVLSAPWLVWIVLGVFLISGLFRHRRRYHGPRHYHW